MIFEIYKKTFSVLLQKPARLWALSLLAGVLVGLSWVLFGLVPGIALGLSILFSASLCLVFLRGYRGQEINAENLFDCFRNKETVKRVLLGMLWQDLWIFLWGCIPIIGIFFAIYKFYSYRFTLHILVEEPEIGITDALKVSMERSQGKCGSMFGADALILLAAAAGYGILLLFAQIPFIGILFRVVLILFSVAVCLLLPLLLGLNEAAIYDTYGQKK